MVESESSGYDIGVQLGQDQPAYKAVGEHFERLISSGRLQPGDRLPTVRQLAARTGLNKATIVQGFSELRRRGLVTSRPGRGTIVAASPSARSVPVADRIQSLYRHLLPEPGWGSELPEYDFSALWPAPSMFPLDAFRRIHERLMRGRPELLQYGSAQGYHPLRQYLEERARHIGIGSGQAVVVQGSQQGLDLIFRTFLNPGDAVAVESPTYAGILPELALHEARVLPVPMETDGLDVVSLQSLIRNERIKLLYFMPNFQNPTGITMSEEKRNALARLAASTGTLLVEDDFEHDLRFSGRERRPVAGRMESANVIYLSTFSKTLLPGLRMGWMIAPAALAEPLVLAKQYTDIHTSILTQAAVNEFCRSGQYDRHLTRLRREYRNRLEGARRALALHMPEGSVWTEPDGGFSLWVTLPEGYDSSVLSSEAVSRGVHLWPGSRFYPGGRGGERSFRLSLSLASEQEIAAGIAILGKLLRVRRAARRARASEARNILFL